MTAMGRIPPKEIAVRNQKMQKGQKVVVKQVMMEKRMVKTMEIIRLIFLPLLSATHPNMRDPKRFPSPQVVSSTPTSLVVICKSSIASGIKYWIIPAFKPSVTLRKAMM
jgi:hypothetical protein